MVDNNIQPRSLFRAHPNYSRIFDCRYVQLREQRLAAIGKSGVMSVERTAGKKLSTIRWSHWITSLSFKSDTLDPIFGVQRTSPYVNDNNFVHYGICIGPTTGNCSFEMIDPKSDLLNDLLGSIEVLLLVGPVHVWRGMYVKLRKDIILPTQKFIFPFSK